MLLNCKPKCTLQDGRTTGSLNTETNEVVCDYCSDIIPNISPFTKQSMRSTGDIVRKVKADKAFMFECESCKKPVETEVRDDKVFGVECGHQLNVPRIVIHGMKMSQKDAIRREANERADSEE